MTAALKIATPENKQLSEFVDKLYQLKGKIKDLQDEAKSLQTSAWEKFEVDKAVIGQMVKEKDWDDKKRAKQKVFEEGCSEVRHALGMQLDMDLNGGKLRKKPKAAAKGPQVKKTKSANKAKAMVDKAKADADRPALALVS